MSVTAMDVFLAAGAIPATLGELTLLKELVLFNNLLTGESSGLILVQFTRNAPYSRNVLCYCGTGYSGPSFNTRYQAEPKELYLPRCVEYRRNFEVGWTKNLPRRYPESRTARQKALCTSVCMEGGSSHASLFTFRKAGNLSLIHI